MYSAVRLSGASFKKRYYYYSRALLIFEQRYINVRLQLQLQLQLLFKIQLLMLVSKLVMEMVLKHIIIAL